MEYKRDKNAEYHRKCLSMKNWDENGILKRGVGVHGRGGLEYLGEGGWSTWERGVEVPGRGGLEYLLSNINQPLHVSNTFNAIQYTIYNSLTPLKKKKKRLALF